MQKLGCKNRNKSMKSLKHLNKYFVKYKWRFILGIIFLGVSNLFGIYMPRVVSRAIDDVKLNISELGNAGDVDSIELLKLGLLAGLTYMGFALGKGFFSFLTRQTLIIMSRLIEYDLKNEIYDQYQKLSLAFYKRNNTGDLLNRISEDVSKVRMYLGPGVMYTINLAYLFTFAIYQMTSISAELTLYALTPLPIMSVIIYLVSNKINKKTQAVQKQQSKISTYAQETFSGIRVLKAYNKGEAFNKEFETEAIQFKKDSLSLVKVNALFMPTIILLIGLSTILTIYLGGRMAMRGDITTGQIAEFVIYINLLTWPFASVGWITSLVQRAAASQARINEFLKQEPEVKNETTEHSKINGNISFENVKFVYPNSGIEAIKNISFNIEQGKSLAIIGRTGSGKSTIANLICRMYDVTSGVIKIDKQKIQNINLNDLRKSIGYVPQEVFLFSDSIKNNIAFGNAVSSDDMEKIKQAAKNADVLENILSFQDKFETILGERGITLSGGQKQRVSIARAIIKEPQILIFDDCLSAVDTETEEVILSNLKDIMDGKTSIFISHRVSTVKHADNIIFIDNGEIIESGSHDDLMKLKANYAELYEKQLLEEKSA